MAENRTYLAIDLKSFYASVECAERGLDPLETNLVVADKSRTEKTICLAVSPSLKSYGIPGRPRLFEVVSKVREINAERAAKIPGGKFRGSSSYDPEIRADDTLALDYVVAVPQMARYMEVSTRIYNIYLKYIAAEDIHVYSIDEVFIDVTAYLKTYGMTARELAVTMIKDVLKETGITATAGIGTNLFLCKAAMDIVAKHIPPDENGVRIAELDERSFRELLWDHRPLTDFWRIGRGYAKKLESKGLFTMGDIALCSTGKKGSYYSEDLLYKMFGVNAELLIDHAWGWEPCTMKEIKAYKPESSSLSSGQVLHKPYPFEKAKLIAREMADLLVLDMVEKQVVADQIVLTVGYDTSNINDSYSGIIKADQYGRKMPGHAHGSYNLGRFTSSTKQITAAVDELFERIVDKDLFVRRMYVVANHIINERDIPVPETEQLSLFTDYKAEAEKKRIEKEADEKEKSVQKAILDIKKKFGKNAVLKGMNLEEDATAKERNSSIGGHRA